MRTFAIVDASKRSRKRIQAAWLYYNEKTKQFSAKINKDYPTVKLPMLFEAYAKKGTYELNHEQVLPWVQERVVPHNRQNIGMVLKEHDLETYDEFPLLLASRGRSSQDNFVIEEEILEDYEFSFDNGEVVISKIGAELAKARKNAGLSQNELAARVGINQGALSRLENGKGNPTVELLVDVASALGKTLTISLA